MMKRNKIISIIVLAVTVLACGFVGWLLIKAVIDRNEAEKQRNTDFSSLQKIYNSEVFPSEENIERVQLDQKELEKWLKDTAGLLHKGDIPESNLSPAIFKQKLQGTVRQLSRQLGIRQGRVVMQDFYFGFDQYLGESDKLPEKEHVTRLNKQLGMIERISKELFDAQILALDSIEREIFETESVQNEPESDRGRRRRRSTRDASSQDAAPEAEPRFTIPEGLAGKERFTFEFIATPEAFVNVLNKLASMDLFVVVAQDEFQKTDDQLKVMEMKPATSMEDGGKLKDHSKLTHAERIVTDPNSDPPVKVKLIVDVYTFEGV